MRSISSTWLSAAIFSISGLFAAAPASAQTFEPIVKSSITADLAEPTGMDAWKAELDKVQDGIAYVDWHLANFMTSPMFNNMLPASATERSEDAACDVLSQNPQLSLSLNSTIDPNDNHRLLDLRADLGDLPDFSLIGCEPVIGAGENGLRIRGFFYFPGIKIETAQMNAMLPVSVDATRIPAGTFGD
jgi:hypothetical protein